jgi:uncharacterized protein YxeA
VFKWLSRKITKNYTEVGLFYVSFNLNKYEQSGAKGSCDLKMHPVLKDDEYVKSTLNSVVDYIRSNYDMEDLSK